MSKLSILESEYLSPSRPYSLNELKDKRKNLYKYINLSDTIAKHPKCNHFYLVKKNGKKDKDIKQKNDYGNCSCCWKLSKTPKHLKDKAYNIINHYSKNFIDDKIEITYDLLDLETIFYKWLYLEFYE